MTQEEIKEARDLAYVNIRDAKDILEKIRKICKHPKTETGHYSYRIGHISPAIICSDCGELIRLIDKP